MLKFLGRFFIFITVVAVLIVLCYLQFFYHDLHLMTQPFATSDDYIAADSCDYTILDTSIKMTSWDSTEAIMTINIYNNGKYASACDYDVNITLVGPDNAITMIASDSLTSSWGPGQITRVSFTIDTASVGYGQQSIYFRIWDDNDKAIVPLNNRLNLEKNGYFIGSLSILHGIINL